MTKLVQPNVLRTYQSGEQYAANEICLYNGVPAYTNTALAQGVAGTAGNFTNIGSNTFSDSLFRIQDNANATKQLAFEVSGIATGTTRTITMSDANVDLGASTSSTLASGAFVYATGMGSVVKTITTNDTTFNVDALEQNPAHSVTIRNGDSSYPYNTPHTFQFVSAKVGGIGSGFVDAQGFGLQDATYINSLSTLTITLQPNESMEVRYLGSGGGFTSIFSMQRNLVGLVAIPASTSDFTLYHERRHSLPHAYAGVLNLKLPITHRIGTSITLEDVVGTSASTITAINITPMGSQTVFALASVDIKNFIDNGCTVKLVLQSSNNWVYNVQYSKVVRGNTLGVRNTAGTLTSLNVVAATSDRVVTFPNADINLGNLSSVATTDSNNLSGTRNRILGGNNNNVDGTDNILIGCSDGTRASGSGRAVIILANRFNTSAVAALAPHSIVLGTSAFDPSYAMGGPYLFAGAVKVHTALVTQPVTASGSTNSLTTDGVAANLTNCLPALLYGTAFMSARHDFDIIITFGQDFAIIPSRTFYAKRTVYVARRVTSEIPLNVTPVLEMSVATPQPDVTLGLGSSTVTINFTLVDNRLIPTVAATSDPSFQRMQVSCRVDSHYNRK